MKEISSSTTRCRKDEKMWPPGFRFHPTDQELVLYYLKRKICGRRPRLEVIGETDVYKWYPDDLPGLSILKTGDRQWFFFSPRDRKYPNGARASRATQHGYWKATGKDRHITCNSRTVGVKKTLVFYKGRAPSGERTDWVMHEYTLDEEELKRCQTAGDYYALYKVFKKSGPGPKNGEQYGAPFIEDEWADDEVLELQAVEIFKGKDQVQTPLLDLGETMNRITAEPAFDKQHNVPKAYALPQIAGEETMIGPIIKEADFTERNKASCPVNQHCGADVSFDVTHSTASQFLQDPYEVSSAPKISHHVNEEDYIEMDDLIDPTATLPFVGQPVDYSQLESFAGQPIESFIGQPIENAQFEDGLSEFDLYNDAAMFVRDMGPIDQSLVSHQFINTVENEMVYNLDYHLQSSFNGEDEVNSQLWLHDQQEGFDRGFNSTQPTPDLPTESNENQTEDAQRSFTSALWNFVESIPTSPADASENVLINRAFERMSSFSRMRISGRSTHGGGTGNGVVSNARRAGRKRGGFSFFSVFVAVCAIFWVFMIGTTVSVLGRYVWS